jgi:short-subunit dehydrogenase
MKRGATVHGVARTELVLKSLKERFGEKFTYTACDLTTDECVDRVITNVKELHGVAYGLINNAGAGVLGDPLGLGPEVFERLAKLLYLTPVKLTLRLVPWMIERGEGVVVNVITLGIVTHIRGLEAYLAPKHALHRFSKDLRDYLSPRGVKVITVYPPVTRTDFFKGRGLQELYHRVSSNPLTRWSIASPEKVAEAIIEAIEAGKEVVTVPRLARALLMGR